MVSVPVHFPRYHSHEVHRHDRSSSHHKRFRCRSYKRVSLLTYTSTKPEYRKSHILLIGVATPLIYILFGIGSVTLPVNVLIR
ncbi:IS1 family transposase [Rahnella sp. PAMC 25559]|uniref:IS1 family transposase n=1 Tax=Rahnella sp. PAMC 25559 TaxID=3423225 RepID=UPI003D67AF1F